MNELPSPEDIEREAAEAGLTMTEVCREADGPYSTFWKWKSGKTSPSLQTVKRWKLAIKSRSAAP